MSFLPDNYDLPKSESAYTKLEQGKTKVRILSDSIVGNLVWKDSKPYRFKQDEEVTVKPSRDGDKPKHFWAFIVWNYNTERVEILELTQKSLQTSIMDCYMNEDYGDPKKYDITITRTGESMETKYSFIPSPPKALNSDVELLYSEMSINLEALFDGEDPFKPSNA